MKGRGKTVEKSSLTPIRRARRQELIDATIKSIAKRGFSGTTLTTVTQEAGLSHGIVNFHFDSKETLYNETLGYLAEEHYAQWSAALAKASDDPAARLEAVIRSDFEANICSRKKLAVWFAFWGQAKHRPTYLEIHNKYDRLREEQIIRICKEIVQDGGYRHLDPVTAARNIEAVIDGHWLQLLLYPKEQTRLEALQNVIDLLAAIFPRHFTGTSEPTE